MTQIKPKAPVINSSVYDNGTELTYDPSAVAKIFKSYYEELEITASFAVELVEVNYNYILIRALLQLMMFTTI